jgi:hypothetical protein
MRETGEYLCLLQDKLAAAGHLIKMEGEIDGDPLLIADLLTFDLYESNADFRRCHLGYTNQ